MDETIYIEGAKEHNLKDISVKIPRNSLVVITGVSGSGKSTLAFDTLYAEGQRRYVESLSAYARQFLQQLQKPQVERITGLPPAIAIEQRSPGSNPRSIVATTTEIYDYLRLLYTHIGVPFCPHCGKRLTAANAQSITDHILSFPEGQKLMLLAPYAKEQKGDLSSVIERLKRDGFVRARIDGEIVELDRDEIKLAKTKKHTIEAVVDRLITGRTEQSRFQDSVELALRTGAGVLTALIENKETATGWQEEDYSEDLVCHDCDFRMPEYEPHHFSFNSPYGACPECHGLGLIQEFKPELVVQKPDLSIQDGAIPAWRKGPRRLITYYNRMLRALATHYDFSLKTPWKELPEDVRNILLYGSGDEIITFSYKRGGKQVRHEAPFEGILPNLKRRFKETQSDAVRDHLRRNTEWRTCTECNGARLRPETLSVKRNGYSIHDFCCMNVSQALEFTENLELSDEEQVIADQILDEIRNRLGFLQDVGLHYLTLDRQSSTLSAGEAQRIRLATQVGSGLVGVLYVLDEPTIGLHCRDTKRLVTTLEQLRDMGNTVVVVEHDPTFIQRADHVVDLGPGPGREGGHIVAEGRLEELCQQADSLTGTYMGGMKKVMVPEQRERGNSTFLRIVGARENNLKKLTVDIPLNTFTCVTGVSGSGKSTLVIEVLKRALEAYWQRNTSTPGTHEALEGIENINNMIVIDQSPIGKTPRSNPATYTGAFTEIRKLFAQTPDAKVRGYKPGRFSFNVKGGRCEDCKGDGVKKIEMNFLPDVHVECETCNGHRYNRETLQVRYKGRTISEALEMTVNEAVEFFDAVPAIYRRLEMLQRVGLGYVKLGQAAPNLSGGEAQRIKLAAELAKKGKGQTLYILDEPTTGLHFADVDKLLRVLFSLRDAGNTVLVIEHNLDVIKAADHLIDLGPEGGDSEGGYLVATGPPEEIADKENSITGLSLRDVNAAAENK